MTVVAHPGPRPAAFTFPFDEARAALDAIEQLVDDLAGCAADHDAATAELLVGFEGASRQAFARWMGDLLDELAQLRRLLDADARELEHQLGVAAGQRREREQAERDWDRQLAAYRDQQRQLVALDQLR